MQASSTIERALGLDILEPEERIDILADLHDLILEGSLIRIVELMNDTQLDELEQLMTRKADEEEIMTYLESIPGARKGVEEAIAELESDILAVTGT